VLAQTNHRGEFLLTNRTAVPLRLVITPLSSPNRSFYWESSAGQEFRLQLEGKPFLVNSGDGVVAFALDSSAVFWGPFITGRSSPLLWEERRKIWTLALSGNTHPTPVGSTNPPATENSRLAPLRVGNNTDSPVRVLLTKTDGSLNGVSWDLTPQKANSEGQELTLANSTVQVNEGDLIFIFATDGSRRYWGPNLVGFTSAPFWDSKRKFWSTLVRP
jgi:hypothetical protein